MLGALSHSLDHLGVTLEPLEIMYLEAYSDQTRQHLAAGNYEEEFKRGQAWTELDAQNALQQAANEQPSTSAAAQQY